MSPDCDSSTTRSRPVVSSLRLLHLAVRAILLRLKCFQEATAWSVHANAKEIFCRPRQRSSSAWQLFVGGSGPEILQRFGRADSRVHFLGMGFIDPITYRLQHRGGHKTFLCLASVSSC